jgi:hypothetical protein
MYHLELGSNTWDVLARPGDVAVGTYILWIQTWATRYRVVIVLSYPESGLNLMHCNVQTTWQDVVDFPVIESALKNMS